MRGERSAQRESAASERTATGHDPTDAVDDLRAPVIVLGSPRSGTSLTARLLMEWGAYGGEPDDQLPPDGTNPRGYFEWMPLAHFHNALFDSIPVTPAHAEFESYLVERAADARWRAAVDELLARIGHGSRRWFWKYPQSAWALPFWRRALPDVRYVVCLREPRSVSLSMTRMYVPSDLAPQISARMLLLLLWQHHMIEILRATDGAGRTLFLSFEALMLQPALECGRLAAFLGPPPAPRSRESLVADLAAAVEPGLWRERADPAAPLTARQEALWRVLGEKRLDPSRPFDPRAYALEPIEREAVNLLLLLNQYHYRVAQATRRAGETR